MQGRRHKTYTLEPVHKFELFPTVITILIETTLTGELNGKLIEVHTLMSCLIVHLSPSTSMMFETVYQMH